jgi:hypothetical protein
LAIREWFKGKIVVYAAVFVISVLFMLFGVRYTLLDGYREISDIIAEKMGGMQSSFWPSSMSSCPAWAGGNSWTA